jgi:hypothetical protein
MFVNFKDLAGIGIFGMIITGFLVLVGGIALFPLLIGLGILTGLSVMFGRR